MSESSFASTVPPSFLVRISTSITRMVPESTNASSSLAISPVKLLAPAGNSATMSPTGPSSSRDLSVVTVSLAAISILLSLLACHRDAQALLGRDQVVGVLGVLAEVGVHPLDGAREDA